jgi:putative addiction module component (TIGR02574 family)
MTTRELIEQIKARALELPKHERESIARELFAAGEELAGDDVDDEGISDEFADELERRLASVRDGTAELIPADVVFAQLRARYPER